MGSTFFSGFDGNLETFTDQRPTNLETKILFDEKVKQEIANLFNQNYKFNLKFKGNISDTPLYHVITMHFYLEATVPL
ncbi:hypothetical protein BH23BAC1_BH23BAC1_33830 [soil metagenome]